MSLRLLDFQLHVGAALLYPGWQLCRAACVALAAPGEHSSFCGCAVLVPLLKWSP